MQPCCNCRDKLLAVLVLIAGQIWSVHALAETQPVSIFIVRHAETDGTQPTIPLSATGRARADLLGPTLGGVRFTHLFATHTTRARQMLDGIASAQGLPVVQLPAPGTVLEGQVVTDQTSRRAPIDPLADALRKLPPGSVAVAALNSENIFAILNRLGVPVAAPGQACASGSMCVPCLDNTCFPPAFDRLWHLVLEPGRATPVALVELRYGMGWQASGR